MVFQPQDRIPQNKLIHNSQDYNSIHNIKFCTDLILTSKHIETIFQHYYRFKALPLPTKKEKKRILLPEIINLTHSITKEEKKKKK